MIIFSNPQPDSVNYNLFFFPTTTFRVKRRCLFTWNMFLVVPYINYFRSMARLGSQLYKITPGKFSLGLPTYMEEIQYTGNVPSRRYIDMLVEFVHFELYLTQNLYDFTGISKVQIYW